MVWRKKTLNKQCQFLRKMVLVENIKHTLKYMYIVNGKQSAFKRHGIKENTVLKRNGMNRKH